MKKARHAKTTSRRQRLASLALAAAMAANTAAPVLAAQGQQDQPAEQTAANEGSVEAAAPAAGQQDAPAAAENEAAGTPAVAETGAAGTPAVAEAEAASATPQPAAPPTAAVEEGGLETDLAIKEENDQKIEDNQQNIGGFLQQEAGGQQSGESAGDAQQLQQAAEELSGQLQAAVEDEPQPDMDPEQVLAGWDTMTDQQKQELLPALNDYIQQYNDWAATGDGSYNQTLAKLEQAMQAYAGAANSETVGEVTGAMEDAEATAGQNAGTVDQKVYTQYTAAGETQQVDVSGYSAGELQAEYQALEQAVKTAQQSLQQALGSGQADSSADQDTVNQAIEEYNAAVRSYNSFVELTTAVYEKNSASAGEGSSTAETQQKKPVYEASGQKVTAEFYVRLDGTIPPENGDYHSAYGNGLYMQDVNAGSGAADSPLITEIGLATMESVGLLVGQNADDTPVVTVQEGYFTVNQGDDGSVTVTDAAQAAYTVGEDGFLYTAGGALYIYDDSYTNAAGSQLATQLAYRYQDGALYVYVLDESGQPMPAVGIDTYYASAYVPGSEGLVENNQIDQQKVAQNGIVSAEGLKQYFSNVYDQLQISQEQIEQATATGKFYEALAAAHPQLAEAFYELVENTAGAQGSVVTQADGSYYQTADGKYVVLKNEQDRTVDFLWYVIKSGGTGTRNGESANPHVDGVMYWKDTLETVNVNTLRKLPEWKGTLLTSGSLTPLQTLQPLSADLKEYKDLLQTIQPFEALEQAQSLAMPLDHIDTLAPVDSEVATTLQTAPALVTAPEVEYLRPLDTLVSTTQPDTDPTPDGEPELPPTGGEAVPGGLTEADQQLQQQIVAQLEQSTPPASGGQADATAITAQAAKTGDSTHLHGWLVGAAAALLGLMGMGSCSLAAARKRRPQ